MRRQIKLIALDLDGTTFNSDKVITERTKQAIASAIAQGVIVMPATGRPKKRSAREFSFNSGRAVCINFQWRRCLGFV